MPDANLADFAGLEMARVHSLSVAGSPPGRLPVHDASAACAPHESGRLVAPEIFRRGTARRDYAHVGRLVIRPQGAVTAANGAIAARQPAWPARHLDTDRSAMAFGG